MHAVTACDLIKGTVRPIKVITSGLAP